MAFQNARRPLLVACIVAGDPDFHESIRIARMLMAAGADMLELVMPFSDPVADGPVIQQAGLRALSAGMNTDRLFELVREVRGETEKPLIIMTYANIVIQRGIEKFYTDAARSGADGVVVADVPLEEAAPFCNAARIANIDPILFVSQTTSSDRMGMILEAAGGFVYLVAAMGVTGIREGINPETITCIRNLKERTPLPVVPGFGISTHEQVQTCAEAGADGVIIGSAIIRLIGEHSGQPAATEREIRSLVRELKVRPAAS
jgi:tryptophan synthase alpha chain